MTVRQGRRGSDVIVIHPGSKFTRIGRACDINPVTVPTVIARKLRGGGTVPEPSYVKGIERPPPGTERRRHTQGTGGGDEYTVSSQSNDPVSDQFPCCLSFSATHSFPSVGHEFGWWKILIIKKLCLIIWITHNSLRLKLTRLSRASENG